MIKPWLLLPSLIIPCLLQLSPFVLPIVEAFQVTELLSSSTHNNNNNNNSPLNQYHRKTSTRLQNSYDDWRSHVAVDVMSLDEENAQDCLDEFIYSKFGQAMFGVHDVPGTIIL